MTLNCYRPVGMTLNCYLRQEGHPALKNSLRNRHVYNLFVDILGETSLPPFYGENGYKTRVVITSIYWYIL